MRIKSLQVGGDAATWRAIGFTVDEDGGVRIGGTRVQLVAGETGVLECAFGDSADAVPSEHANTALRIDHVVVLVESIESYSRTVPMELRRIREGEAGTGQVVRQGFFRLGEVILEAVEDPGAREPRFWGLTVGVADLDAAAALLGERLGRVKDAVQPGRRIATVRKEASAGLPLALIST